MSNYVITKNKDNKKISTREELEAMDHASLVDKVLQLEAHNFQLKRIIKKAELASCPTKKHKDHPGDKKFDFSKYPTRHIFLKFFYLGWGYHGFVEQEDNDNTIEEHIFRALTRSCLIKDRQSSNYHRCGRTDKGVSAFSQVISLDVRSCLELSDQDKVENELDYCKMLNRLLPSDIRCYAWAPVRDENSARFDCKLRTYKYFFPRGYLNIEAMNEAARFIVGSHDFRNFCKMDVANGVVRFDRTVNDAKIVVIQQNDTEPSRYDMCQFIITSPAFLWHQIRCIMGVLLLVGQGKEDPGVVRDLLDTESCPRKPQYGLAHELPLNLNECHYEDIRWFRSESEVLLVVRMLEQHWTLNAIKSAMIRDMLDDLKHNFSDEQLTSDVGQNPLLQGVQSAKYQPLMKRLTCESLENRIKHFEKKRKIQVADKE